MSHPKVLRVIHARTQHLGPDELLVAAEVAVRPVVPGTARIYLEPDLDREPVT